MGIIIIQEMSKKIWMRNENMKNKISELMKEINIIKEENEKLKKEIEDVITSSSDFYSINPISIENQSYYYKKLGNTFSFFGNKNGDPIIIIGPHWPMYICFCSFVSIGMMFFFSYFWVYLHFFLKFQE